jgi:lysophospholipase L1-like esterase
VLVAASVIVAGASFAHPAAAAAALRPGDKYVALGSSFASGPMIPPTADASCLRSARNYPHLVAAALKLSLTDVSCGAATTDNILSAPQGAHPPQLTAVTPDTKLVTVTIGGNDVNYTVSNLACGSAGARGQSCVGPIVMPAQVDAALAALPAKMATTLQAIKDAAPHARVVVFPYLRVMPASASPCPPSVPIEAADLRFLVDFGQRLYTVIKQSAAAAKVDFVDSYAPKGHDACAAPARRWVEGEVPASSAFMFHPNAAGMKAQANMLVKRLRSQS